MTQALQPILDGFRWLGIDWDEGPEVGGPYAPYYQSQRLPQYQAAAALLLEKGFAYRDYATPEETAAERLAAEKEKREFVYSRKWMAETDEDIRRFEAQGRQFVVRLKMPREGQCGFHDLVRGDVSFDWAREQDHVIQRADGTCLYHLASVVDDYDFRITHIVRAVEHLSNTPRQIFIAQSLGYEIPKLAHLPFVAEPGSKNKLSKRKIAQYLKNPDFKKLYDHGVDIARRTGLDTDPESFNPVLVEFYRAIGFLPEAITNYLLLLGWSLDGQSEHFSRDEMIDKFSLDRVVKSEASFDPQKLTAFQQHYMNQLPLEKKVALAIPFLESASLISDPPPGDMEQNVTQIIQAADDRITVAGDILQFDEFFVDDDAFEYDEKAFEKRLLKDTAAKKLIASYAGRLAATDDFTAQALHEDFKSFCQTEGIKPGQIIHALRLAVTGKSVGFGMFDTLAILGKQRCIKRIERTLHRR